MTQETSTRLWRLAFAYDSTLRALMMPLSPTRCGHQPHEIAPLLTLRAVRRALATLSTTHREMIELAYFRDLGQSQIADRLIVGLGGRLSGWGQHHGRPGIPY